MKIRMGTHAQADRKHSDDEASVEYHIDTEAWQLDLCSGWRYLGHFMLQPKPV